MHFAFDDDQLAFQSAVRDLLEKECPPEVVRAAWGGGRLDRSVWSHLSEMGVLGTLVPEDAGGLGLDERSLVLVLEETGRAALPHPIVDTAVVAAPLLARPSTAGTGGPMDDATDIQGRPRSEPVDVVGGTIVATDLGGPNVACAADVDAFLLRRDSSLYLAEPAAVALQPVDTVDRARRAARIRWDTDGSALVTDDPDEIDAAFDRGAFATAAQLVGLGQRMLDTTVEYVQQRQQFGRPVGAFQAVKHHLADALKELAFARPAVYRAAHSLAVRATTRSRDVSLAKAMASNAACLVGRKALQCHGAIGYTVESDLHLYLKRTWALAAAWGDAAWHRDRIGRALGI